MSQNLSEKSQRDRDEFLSESGENTEDDQHSVTHGSHRQSGRESASGHESASGQESVRDDEELEKEEDFIDAGDDGDLQNLIDNTLNITPCHAATVSSCSQLSSQLTRYW